MRTLLLATALVILSLHTYGRKVEGIIIANGETREVTFDIKVPVLRDEPNFERIQYKVRYYDENGKKQTLLPDQADEILFEYEGIKVRMISCANIIGAGGMFSIPPRIFLKLEIDGPLKLYRYYYKHTTSPSFGAGGSFTGGMTYTVDDVIFQKGNGPLKQPRSFGWRKDMLDYFRDCPDLHERLESKDLRRKEIEAIVLYYNQHCAGESGRK